MSVNSLGLGVLISAQDAGASAVFGSIGGHLTRLSSNVSFFQSILSVRAVQDFARGMMNMGLSMAEAGRQAAIASGKFERLLVGIQRITGATASSISDASSEAFDLTRFGFDPTTSLQGLRTLTTMGFNASDAIAALRQSAVLATVSLGDLGMKQAAESLGGVLKAFNKSGKDAKRIVDEVAQVSFKSAFSLKDFG